MGEGRKMRLGRFKICCVNAQKEEAKFSHLDDAKLLEWTVSQLG